MAIYIFFLFHCVELLRFFLGKKCHLVEDLYFGRGKLFTEDNKTTVTVTAFYDRKCRRLHTILF